MPTAPSISSRSSPDPWTRAALAALVAPVAFLGAALASLVTPATASGDRKYVAVVGAVALVLTLARYFRPGVGPSAKRILLRLSAPALSVLIWPHSSLTVGWLTFLMLGLGADALLHTSRAACSIRKEPASKLALSIVAVAPGLLMFFSLALVVSLMFVTVAPIRAGFQLGDLDAGEEVLAFVTEDGLTLESSYTPGAVGAPGVLLVHGVGGGRRQYRPWARRLAPAGYHALRVDLRGHGTSEGAISTYGQHEDADIRAAVDALRAQPGVDRDRIIVVAASMGGGTVLAASPTLAERGVVGLVLLAPASRYSEVIAMHAPFPGRVRRPVFVGPGSVARAIDLVPLIEWSPADQMDHELPILMFHGDRDRTIPLEMNQRLAATTPTIELHVLPGVAHDDIQDFVPRDEGSWRLVEDFLEEHVGTDDRPHDMASRSDSMRR